MKRNFFDLAIGFFAPGAALRRLSNRVRLNAAEDAIAVIEREQKRKYEGAAKGRHYSDWYSTNQSVNQEVLTALSILRARSRDLDRNNGYAINATRIITNNVVGTGIIPAHKGLRANQTAMVKDAWAQWAGTTACDYDDMNTFYGLEWLIMKTITVSGEAIIRRARGISDDPVPLRLQVLEGDFLDSAKHDGQWQGDGTITYYGIKFDSRGKRLGYWLYKHHPNEFGGVSEFVKAEDIIHIYEVERPGQLRGIPMSCGVMLRLKDLDDYEFTERIRSKVAAAFAVFITEDNPEGDSAGLHKLPEKIEPGMIEHLPPGKNVQVAQPPKTDGFGEFVKNNLRGISAGFGTSYEALTNDYSNVNFSSGRMGWIEANRNYERYQYHLMIARFCQKVYPWFIEALKLKGVIPFTANAFASWTPPRRQMIDPLKEIQAIKEEIRAGLTSWQEVIRMFGYIPEELTEELKKDKEMWDKLGLMPTSDPRFDNNRPPEEVLPDGEDEGKDPEKK